MFLVSEISKLLTA